MLEPIAILRSIPRELIDRSKKRVSLAPLEGQRVLFSGEAREPQEAGKTGRFLGGPSYTVGFGPGARHAVIQPYDPEGLRSPAETGPPLAVDHVTAYHNRDRSLFDNLPPVHRTASGPVVGVGLVRQDPANPGFYKVAEAPYGTASGFYNDHLLQIAALPSEQRLQAYEALRENLYNMHERQAIGYDVSASTVADALNRLESAVEANENLTSIMRALQLPRYTQPPVPATIIA